VKKEKQNKEKAKAHCSKKDNKEERAKSKKTSKSSKKEDSATEGIVKRNFVPGDESDSLINKIHWEGALGSDYSIKLHTWSANSNSYINIRKGRGVGPNIPIQLYWRLMQALKSLKQDYPSVVPVRPIDFKESILKKN